jgi:hypothetical protein
MAYLTIRDAQMATLVDAFQLTWLCSEIEALYPVECRQMGADGVRRFVDASRSRARGLGLTSRDDLSYVALEITFGEGFIEQPWAREALPGDVESLMPRLRHAAIFRLAAIAENEQRQEDADRHTTAVDDEVEEEHEHAVENGDAQDHVEATLEGE